MKNPVKYAWKSFPSLMLISAVFVLFLALISNGATPMSLLKGIAMLGMYLVLLFLDAILIVRWGTILNRKVDHSVIPEELVVGQRYWLNGETWADYAGFESYTGQYIFAIYEVHNRNDPHTRLLRGQVSQYISKEQEVFE